MEKSKKEQGEKVKVVGLWSWKKKKMQIGIGMVLLIGLVGAAALFLYNGKEKVDSEYIVTLLEKSIELTTAKLHYTGMSEYKDTGVPILNRADFIMVYEATARIGIDLKNVEVKVDASKERIYLTIPKAEVIDVKVNQDKTHYFDNKFALLNLNEKEDGNKANVLAEQEAEKEIEKMGVLEMADTQAETLIKGILKDVVPKEYKYEVKRK